MTLGSALPWRARSTLGRIQPRLSLIVAPRSPSPRTVQHGYFFFRAQSSQPADQGADQGAASTPKPHFPYRDPSAEYSAPEATTDAPSSLMDRLASVPVRRHGTWDPVVVRPVTPYPHKREDREGQQRYHRELTQQARMEAYRENFQAGDWRTILQTLMKSSDTYTKPKDGIKVVIPKQSADLLLSEREKNNVWNIRARTGCGMTLYQSTGLPPESATERMSESKGEYDDPFIMLSGHPGAVSAAIDDILEVSKRVTIVKIQGATKTVLHAGAQPPPTDGSVTATPILGHRTPVPNRPHTLNVRADRIPRPSEWTTETFHHYIAVLTLARPHGGLARRLYRNGETHQRTVVRQLHLAFNDPDASAAVGLPALKLALQYLEGNGETFVKDARLLFQRVARSGLRMDTEVNNLMLVAAAKAKNLVAFQARLNDMIRAGHRPNVRTWLLFLRIIEAEEVRRYILYAMQAKGYFSDQRVVSCVSVDMADHDIYRAIQLNHDLPTFLSSLHAVYGQPWRLRTRAANRYLDIFGRYSKFDEMQQLLYIMFASKNAKPNTISLNTVLTHCKHQNRVDLAVGFVRLFDERFAGGCKDGVADKITFHLLLEMAHKTRKPHLFGAVWRYAHLLEMTSYRLWRRGMKLLLAGREIFYMTDRISGLWETLPGVEKVSRGWFMERLLLCDFYLDGKAAGDTPAEAARKYRSRTRGLDFIDKYWGYARWAFGKSQGHVPAEALGDFLQAALGRDRALHKLAHEGVGEVHNGLPVAMTPEEMTIQPLSKLRFGLESLPPWLSGGGWRKDWLRINGGAETKRTRERERDRKARRSKQAQVKRKVRWLINGQRGLQGVLKSYGAA
jgi:hypothetical protein